MKRERKTSPADYPIFAFRVSKEDKERLSKLIDEVQERLNKKLSEEYKRLNKNDVIVEALQKGLNIMKR